MAFVSLKRLSKNYGSVPVLNDIDLDIARGEFTVLLGPSGCGKSTTLRLVAGLEPVSSGTIHIDGRDVTALEPRARDIAMVFQNYALYPTMTVEQNMAFGLKAQKLPPAIISEKVHHTADLLGLIPLLNRKPGALPGGQQQRVAIGRAIVREPKVFLFDEPLSNLDAKLRIGMRGEILGLHKRLKATTVYVTHDQEEAMAMADRIVIMNGGTLEQIGTPEDIYFRPATRMVAGFIGSPAMNFFDAVGLGDGRVNSEFGNIAVGHCIASARHVEIGFRPDNVRLSTGVVSDPDDTLIECTVGLTELLGPRAILHLQNEVGRQLTAVVPYEDLKHVKAGGKATFVIQSTAIHVFDAITGKGEH